MTQTFGRSGAELLPMADGNIGELVAAADRLGIVLSEECVAAGRQLGDPLATLEAVGASLLRQIPQLPFTLHRFPIIMPPQWRPGGRAPR
ncbi:MAG: hypothetical protein ACE148_09295 [Vicinamibacterales bacterium]